MQQWSALSYILLCTGVMSNQPAVAAPDSSVFPGRVVTTANAAFAAQDLDSLPPGLSPGDTQAAAQPVDVPNAMPPPLTPEAYQNALSEFWAQQDSLAVAAAPGTPNAAAFAVQPAGLAEQLRLLVESTAPSSDHGDVRAHAINLLAAIERVQPEGGSTAQPTAAFGAAAEHISAHSLPCDDGPDTSAGRQARLRIRSWPAPESCPESAGSGAV